MVWYAGFGLTDLVTSVNLFATLARRSNIFVRGAYEEDMYGRYDHRALEEIVQS